MGGLESLFGSKKHSVNESLTDVAALVNGIDAGKIMVHGVARQTLNQDEIALLSESFPEAVEAARKKGMIIEDDDRGYDVVH